MNLVELVPRDIEHLKKEAQEILAQFPFINGFNIPDVLRLENRSHDAARALLDIGINAIPHIRTVDRSLEETTRIVHELVDAGLTHVLFVTGDHLENGRTRFEVSPLHITEVIKPKFPNLKVYCGMDPYRQSFQQELVYCRQKKEAGADGLFSQPFFDKDLARIYLEQLEGFEFFVGISPVLTEKSFHYWINRNHAFFPKKFKLTEESNYDIGAEIVETAHAFNQHCYLMPITFSATDYVRGVFTPRRSQ